MAKRNGPTDGGRFKRATPSGNHKRGRGKSKVEPKPAASRETLDRSNREHLLTPERLEKIVKLIRAGNYAEVAAACAGISKGTFYKWLARGAEGEQPFKQLVDAVETATAESEARDVMVIGQAAARQWQAAAWRLERKNPKRWGRKDGLELTGDESKPVAVTVIKFGDEEISFS